MTVLPGRKTVLAVSKQGGRMAGFYSSSSWYKKLCISLVIVFDSLFYNFKIKQLSHKLIPENELEKTQLVLADGHACLGEMLLFVGKSEEARKNLEIALRGFKDYCGPENVLLDKANVLHFLGEAYRNRYSSLVKILWFLVRSHLQVFNKLLWCDTVLK